MDQKKKIVISILGITAVILLVIGISYAYWKYTTTQENSNIVNSDCFKLEFVENETSDINIEGYPISDEDGRKLIPYTFTINNKCSAKAKYSIRLEVSNSSTLKSEYLKSMLNSNDIVKLTELKETNPSLSNMKNSYILEESNINGGESKNYEFRLWLDGGISKENSEAMNKIFTSKISVEGVYDSSYREPILNGTDPVLKNNLIPVTISDDGTVRKADINSKWYSYENKNWANAVILEDETKEYQNKETIPESNIESYFVWIPRYKYQIFDNGLYSGISSDSYVEKSQEIKIEFESKKTVATKGTKKGDWLTHPAFTSFDVNGMWVGKFETGYKGATSTETAQSNTNDSSKVQIKPNVYSWRNIQIANAHLNSYNYERDLDSHMMKNTEWGAVTYLSHSKYGVTNRIRINNNSQLLTGYAAVNEPTCGRGVAQECNISGNTSDITLPYNTNTGYLASTTGNITGIYDMAGGTWENVMTSLIGEKGLNISGKNSLYNSGFNGAFNCPTCDGQSLTELTTGTDLPASKYYDVYSSKLSSDYGKRLLGDATGEMGPFFLDYESGVVTNSWNKSISWFANFSQPAFPRGGNNIDGINANLFSFATNYGNADPGITFRVVLAL